MVETCGCGRDLLRFSDKKDGSPFGVSLRLSKAGPLQDQVSTKSLDLAGRPVFDQSATDTAAGAEMVVVSVAEKVPAGWPGHVEPGAVIELRRWLAKVPDPRRDQGKRHELMTLGLRSAAVRRSTPVNGPPG